MNSITDYKAKVLKALQEGTINKVEAKECMKRGGEFIEVPIFYDTNEPMTSIMIFSLALEKMQMIEPLIRLGNDE
jgi:hypothetical protein